MQSFLEATSLPDCKQWICGTWISVCPTRTSMCPVPRHVPLCPRSSTTTSWCACPPNRGRSTRPTACRPTTCWTSPREFSGIEATEAGDANSPYGGWLRCRVLPGIDSSRFGDRMIEARETRSCSDIATMQSSRATGTSRRLDRMTRPIEESRTWERLRRLTPEKETES